MHRTKSRVTTALAVAGLLAVSVLLAGCATQPVAGTAAAVPSDKAREECIFSLTLRDWSAIDSQRLIIYGISRKEPYLVTLFFPSTDLLFAVGIGVYDGDRNGRICGFGNDALLFPRGVPDRITIKSVVRISVEEAKRLTDEAKPKKKTKAD